MSGNATEPAAELRAIVIRRKKTDDPPLTIWGIETLERQKRCAPRLPPLAAGVRGHGDAALRPVGTSAMCEGLNGVDLSLQTPVRGSAGQARGRPLRRTYDVATCSA